MKRALLTVLSPHAARPALRSQIQPTNHLRIMSTPTARRHAHTLKDPSLFKQQCYINGAWVDAKSGKTFEIEDPATGTVIGTMPEMSKEDTQTAIDAAAAALPAFRQLPGRQRARMLHKWFQLMMENQEDLATLIMWENGKAKGDAMGEVVYAANFFEWFSEEAPRAGGDTIPASTAGNRVFTIKQPVGVCGLITPWVRHRRLG